MSCICGVYEAAVRHCLLIMSASAAIATSQLLPLSEVQAALLEPVIVSVITF